MRNGILIFGAMLAGMLWDGSATVFAKTESFDYSFLTLEEFEKGQKNRLEESRRLLEQVKAVKGGRTIANTLDPLNAMNIHISNAFSLSGLMSSVHPDDALQESARASQQEFSKFYSDVSLDRELYDALLALAQNKNETFSEEVRTVLNNAIDDFKREGVDKPQAVRDELKALNESMTKYRQAFNVNLQKDVRSIKITEKDLKGLPEDYVEKIKAKNELTVSTDYPEYIPFMKYSSNREKRMELYKAAKSRGYPANKPVLKDVLKSRKRYAELLGFKNYAEYVTEDKMVGTPEKAAAFIEKVHALGAPKARFEMNQLLLEMRKDFPKAMAVQQYDASYYINKLLQSKVGFDQTQMREYLNYADVKNGLFEIIQKMFGVTFKPVELKLWHEDVESYDVLENGKVIARFHLDLFPRDNKFKHAAQFTIRSGAKGVQLPEGVLVCNFNKPDKNGKGLMEISQVITFFHEFGHLLHHSFQTKHKWIANSGVKEWDFVEAPSQVFEEWVKSYDSLKLFAKHHKTGKVMPKELLDKYNAAEKLTVAMDAMHQIYYSALSLNIYQKDPETLDVEKLVNDLKRKYSPYPVIPDTHFVYGFGHLIGYSAIYYTYTWSLVIAKDMFSEFEKAGVLNPDVAMRYRTKILEPGGTKNARELVKDFLGREYSFRAFRSHLVN